MIIKKDIFYKAFLLFILLVTVAIASIEVTISVCLAISLIFLFDVKFKYSNTFINTLTPLVGVFIIAGISTFFYKREIYDVIKDFVYLIKPIMFIWLGFYLTGKIRDKEFIFKVILYLGAFFAAYHMYEVFIYFLEKGFNFSVQATRYVGGKANYVELFAMVLLHLRKDLKPFQFKIKFHLLLRLLLYASFVLYFSRTMLLGFVVLYLSINGYTKLTRKGIIYISVFLIAGIAFFSVLMNLKLDRTSTGVEGFFYKLQNAPSEIFTTDVDINDDDAKLWDHWRGYEANRAFSQLDEAPYNYGYVFGKGMGSLVDLGFEAPLNVGGIQHIPIIHNGFAYIVFKSGFVGLFLYLIFLLSLYLLAYKRTQNNKLLFTYNLISGVSIFFFFTTLTITGIYNHGDVVTFFLGSFLFLKKYYHQNETIAL